MWYLDESWKSSFGSHLPHAVMLPVQLESAGPDAKDVVGPLMRDVSLPCSSCSVAVPETSVGVVRSSEAVADELCGTGIH